MMRKQRQQLRKFIIGCGLTGVYFLCVTTAWATLSFVKPNEPSSHFEQATTAVFTASNDEKSRTRAPEPATIVLFGGGILGMIAGFIRSTYLALKRILDVCAAIAGILILSPLFLLTAILVKLTSRGPILFSQTRVGKDGQLFNIYKFRTMRVDAEKETGPVWAAANDSRLIPVGEFLRKAHIDELPQLFNILKGEMSLIGPRPERPVFVERFKSEITGYEKRLAVKPGITGLAQVWHKYDETIEDVKKKIKYDILYIKKFCLWTDLRILLRTVRVVFTGEGAR